MILGNGDPYNEQYLKVNIMNLRKESNNKKMQGQLLFSTNEAPRIFSQFIDNDTLDIHLGAGEVKIIEL